MSQTNVEIQEEEKEKNIIVQKIKYLDTESADTIKMKLAQSQGLNCFFSFFLTFFFFFF